MNRITWTVKTRDVATYAYTLQSRMFTIIIRLCVRNSAWAGAKDARG